MKFILISLLLGALSTQIFSIDQKKSSSQNHSTEGDWESELEKELEEKNEESKNLEDLRGRSKSINQPLDRSAQNLMMDIQAGVDMVGSWDKNKKKNTENSFDIRKAEFGFTGSVDQWIRGNLLVAAHNNNGEYHFEVHEANAFFPFLVKYVTLKAGKMFLDLGRLNRIHRHDWAFTTAPIVHSKLMDIEAVQDTGAEVNILVPWQNLTQEIVIGATNGRVWGHSHGSGQSKNNPMAYVHLKNFYYIGDNWGTQFGLTAIRYEPDASSNKTIRTQYGADILLRWNRSFLKSFMFMGEVWYRETRFPETMDLQTYQNKKTPMETLVGYYFFADYQFHQQWHIGFRYDFFTIPNLRDKFGYLAENAEIAYTPQLTYKPSEFSYIRLSLERRYTKDFTIQPSNFTVKSDEEWVREYSENPKFEKAKTQMVTYQIYLQCTFILGSHPLHTY